MSLLTNLVARHDRPWVTVGLFGQHDQMVYSEQVFIDSMDTAVSMGADKEKICVMVPASGQSAVHFQKMLPAYGTTRLDDRTWADAVWTQDPMTAIILPTADCQSVVIKNLVTGMLVVAHGGKPAMTPGHIVPRSDWNILDLCIVKAIENADPTNLQIYVTGAISGDNYRHDDQAGQQAIKPFLQMYGKDVFVGDPAEGCLDLFSVTKHVAERHSIPLDQVTSDGSCTFTHPNLTSYRKNDQPQKRNITIVVNRPVQI